MKLDIVLTNSESIFPDIQGEKITLRAGDLQQNQTQKGQPVASRNWGLRGQKTEGCSQGDLLSQYFFLAL